MQTLKTGILFLKSLHLSLLHPQRLAGSKTILSHRRSAVLAVTLTKLVMPVSAIVQQRSVMLLDRHSNNSPRCSSYFNPTFFKSFDSHDEQSIALRLSYNN
mmetsp:Transcript_19464/g.39249  ORF Transcript_19464/g.39249 Transcript_19464/m.39249 type:complete len:101 (-) Transcript_19464:287-589(-)